MVDSTEEIEFFFKKSWSDGLPVVVPTEERIERMLKGTSRKSEEVIGEVPPNFEILTVRMVAEHAVMAGCLPEFMPIILGGMKAILYDQLNMNGVQTTIHSVAPLMIVNGPYAKKVGLQGGRGCFGPGFRANATIGRAVRLILFNVGGGIPAASSSSFSQPCRYTFCIAENEEESPWESLAETRGFKRDENVVTVVQCENPDVVHDDANFEPERLHVAITDTMAHLGAMNSYRAADIVVALSPDIADNFAKSGFSKKEVHQILCENAGRRVGDLKRGGLWGLNRLDRWVSKVDPNDDDCFVPTIQEPSRLFLIVAGGRPGPTSAVMHGWNETSRGVSLAYEV